mgnify:CR=1 FL=1
MAVTYRWNINEVKVYPTGSDTQEPVNTFNDVIHEITYTLEGSDTHNGIEYRDTHTDVLYISTDNLSTFTPFVELNQETVIGWVKTILTEQTTSGNQSLIESLKSSIADNIEGNKNPTTMVKYLP